MRRFSVAIEILLICILFCSCDSKDPIVRVNSSSTALSESVSGSKKTIETDYLYFSESGTAYHIYEDCPIVSRISPENLVTGIFAVGDIENAGYHICSTCKKRLEAESTSADREETQEYAPNEEYNPQIESATNNSDTEADTATANITPKNSETADITTTVTGKYKPVESETTTADVKTQKVTETTEKPYLPDTKTYSTIETTTTSKAPGSAASGSSAIGSAKIRVIVNVNSKVAHTNPDCPYAAKIKPENSKELIIAELSELEAAGYRICSNCAKHQNPTAETNAETSAQNVPETIHEETAAPGMFEVIINKSSLTFHVDPQCRHVKSMKEENRGVLQVSDLSTLIDEGYKPCGTCSKEYLP